MPKTFYLTTTKRTRPHLTNQNNTAETVKLKAV
jgi:hypothetical protein